ncbi:beta-lactamase-like protein [Lipomyces tetrasporus]|uniref:Beta-lactamase-like protein n=1 Tax=Lipomyces tetrasporus TaxID=54092 RepID=A0AAD7QZ05_9ASCO|nr:beta-lactamase-like protein [Lipomyces tetrasporus]KAJ8102422.1 beta-lactamase-like protein [Lipomyces tetrasporus]
MSQISPRVLRVLGQNAGKFTLQGTNTYIVGTGSHRLIIDTGQGIPEWANLISSVLAEQNITLSHVLLTHWHGDHAGGVPDLLRLYPHLNDSIYKHSPSKTQQPIMDGQVFNVEGATVRALHSPGHSHDHMCFVIEEDNAICPRAFVHLQYASRDAAACGVRKLGCGLHASVKHKPCDKTKYARVTLMSWPTVCYDVIKCRLEWHATTF